MVRSIDVFYERVRVTPLVQVCKCGTFIRATRQQFDTVAHEHFTKNCTVVQKLGGQPVRPVWAGWSNLPILASTTATVESTQLIRNLRFSAPISVPAWASIISSAPMIEPVFLTVREELSDSMLRWESAIHNMILRLLHKPELQPVMQTMIGLLDSEPGSVSRNEEFLNLVHRVALGTYG